MHEKVPIPTASSSLGMPRLQIREQELLVTVWCGCLQAAKKSHGVNVVLVVVLCIVYRIIHAIVTRQK